MSYLDVGEQNKLKAICSERIPKATEKEWQAMKVMLPIVKAGVGSIRAESKDFMFGANSLTTGKLHQVWE